MPTTPEPRLSLEEVAWMADDLGVLEKTVPQLGELVRTGPQFAGQLEELRALARDAGLDPEPRGALSDGLVAHEAFERLLAAEPGHDPEEVLDPEAKQGVPYAELLAIATARADRAADPAPLLELKARLQDAFAREHQGQKLVERFVTGLLEQPPKAAERLLRLAMSQHKTRRRQR